MKERANGADYRAYDYDMAISIINLLFESGMTTPFLRQREITSVSVKTPVQDEQGLGR